MEQLADFVPMVQILDDPVPQMVDQLVEVFRLLGSLGALWTVIRRGGTGGGSAACAVSVLLPAARRAEH